MRNTALALPRRYLREHNMKLRRGLTELQVRNAKPKAEPYEISDGHQRGLRLAVQPSGAKSWVVRYRHPVSGTSRKLTLQPGLGIAEARKLTGDAMFQVAQGIDPIDAKREQKQAAVSATECTPPPLPHHIPHLSPSPL